MPEKHEVPADVNVPAGHQLYNDESGFSVPAEGEITVPSGDTFRLTGRSWEQVNAELANLPGGAIEHMIKHRSEQGPVNVLDIGAGVRGAAVRELQEYYGQDVQALGVDLATSFEDPAVPRKKLVASATSLPLATGSIDVAFSRQAVVFIGDSDPRELQAALDEAARVLRPGGVFIFDGDIASLTKRDEPLVALPADVLAYQLDGTDHREEMSVLIKNLPDHALLTENNEAICGALGLNPVDDLA